MRRIEYLAGAAAMLAILIGVAAVSMVEMFVR